MAINQPQPLDANLDYNQYNLKRYNDIVSGYGNRLNTYNQTTERVNSGFDNALAQYMGVGDSQRTALGQQYSRNMADAQQSAISRGLGNSTVLDSLNRGVNYDYANSLVGLNDTLAMNRANMQMQQLGYLGQAQQGAAGAYGDLLGFQGQAFGQQYGAGAQYASQSALQSQGANYNYDLAQQGAGNQQQLATQQYQQTMQQMAMQHQYAKQDQDNYGWY